MNHPILKTFLSGVIPVKSKKSHPRKDEITGDQGLQRARRKRGMCWKDCALGWGKEDSKRVSPCVCASHWQLKHSANQLDVSNDASNKHRFSLRYSAEARHLQTREASVRAYTYPAISGRTRGVGSPLPYSQQPLQILSHMVSPQMARMCICSLSLPTTSYCIATLLLMLEIVAATQRCARHSLDIRRAKIKCRLHPAGPELGRRADGAHMQTKATAINRNRRGQRAVGTRAETRGCSFVFSASLLLPMALAGGGYARQILTLPGFPS